MESETPAFFARRLIRGATAATLATQREGQPFASLVTPAAAPDVAVLLWLSDLSEHTRQLRAEPRCALLFAGTPAEANPQTAPRVTVTGLAETVSEAEGAPLKARWLAHHPYAALYAEFGDFRLWRVRIGGALLVGGFARATRIGAAALRPDAVAVAAIAAAEAGICDHMNEDHADAVAAIAATLPGGGPGAWRMLAVDVDGALLGTGEAACRLEFTRPVASAAEVRDELVSATRAVRARSAAGRAR